MGKVKTFLSTMLVLILCASLMVISTTTITDTRTDTPIVNATTGLFVEVNVTDDVCIVGGDCLSSVTGTGDNVVVDVTEFGATGDGSTDDADAFQDAVDSISTTGGVIYIPNGTYNLTHSIFINASSATLQFIVQGAGFGTLLKPDFESSTGNNFTFMINENAGGSNPSSYPASPRVVFRDLRAVGDNTDNVSFAYVYQTGVWMKNVKLQYFYYGLKTGNTYSDRQVFEEITSQYTRRGGYFYYQSNNGDGVYIKSSYFEGGAAYIDKAYGVHIDAVIGGDWYLKRVQNGEISNSHFEIQTYLDWFNTTILTIRDSDNVIVRNNWFGNRYGNQMINIQDTAGTESSKVYLENNNFVLMTEDETQERAVDINISNVETSTEIYFKNNRGYVNLIGLTIYEPWGLKVTSGESAIQTLLDNRQHVFGGEGLLKYDGTDGWKVTSVGVREIDVCPYMTNPSISYIGQQTASTYQGNVDTGTNYFYAVASWNECGMWTNTSAVSNKTATADNVVIEMTINARNSPGMLRIWRGNAATNLTHYVDIPVFEYAISAYDQGAMIAGYSWQSSAPAVTTASNSTELLDFNGGLEIGSISVVTNASLCWTGAKKIGYCSGSINTTTGVCGSCIAIT